MLCKICMLDKLLIADKKASRAVSYVNGLDNHLSSLSLTPVRRKSVG